MFLYEVGPAFAVLVNVVAFEVPAVVAPFGVAFAAADE